MKIDTAFWDSSALFPLCCTQSFSVQAARVRRQFPRMALWWGTTVEINCAIARLARDAEINEQYKLLGLRRWGAIYRGAKPIEPSSSLLELAIELPTTYPLRAMDTFQLAAALVWCGERPRNRPFVCADRRLSDAARNADFNVIELA